MAAPPPKGSSSGSGLQKKLGPFPVWVWALVGAGVAFVLYRVLSSSSSSPAATQQQAASMPAAAPSSPLGDVPTAGSPSDTGATTSDVLQTLGAQQNSLLASLEAQNQDVVGLAASQIANLQTSTALGSFNTQTQGVLSTQPGGSQAPMLSYASPNLVTQSGQAPPAAVKASSSAVAPAKGSGSYFTYKRDVPLGQGQTVHFRSGYGYYAA